MYNPHPSRELNALFSRRPFQGVEPKAATFLFIGLDANYVANIENTPIFQSLLDYHRDGAAFWSCYGVHHPFLLPAYRGDGRRYHINFARIGFTPRHAAVVSFAELLHLPTVGRSQLEPEDLDPEHLRALSLAMLEGPAEHVFVSTGVLRLMRLSRQFWWLSPAPVPSPTLPVLYASPGKRVYLHLHFSNYGKYQRQMDAEARAIASLLPKPV